MINLELYYFIYVVNNPVNNIDLRGDSIITITNSTIENPDGTTTLQSTTYYYGQNSNGDYGFSDSNGNAYAGGNSFIGELTTALDNLRSGAVGNALVNDLMSSAKIVDIKEGDNNWANKSGKRITWNSTNTEGGPNQNGDSSRPPYIGLGHEMGHIQDRWNGTYKDDTWVIIGKTKVPEAEKYSIKIENLLRQEHGLPLRTHYNADYDETRVLRYGTDKSLY